MTGKDITVDYKDMTFKLEEDFYGEQALICNGSSQHLLLNPTGRKENEYYIFINELPAKDQSKIRRQIMEQCS